MADEPEEVPEGEEVLELEVKDIAPEPEAKEPDAPQAEDDEEVILTIGDEVSPASGEENATIRQMREALKAKEDRIRELERGTESKPIEIGEEPSLESCNYDEDAFKADWKAWNSRNTEAEAAKTKARQAVEEVQTRWNAKLAEYGTQKDTLRARDFETAEAAVLNDFSEVQQSIVISGAKNKALVVLALGRNPARRAELAKLTDPIEFAVAIGQLEAQTKMERRKPATNPEGRVQGSGSTTSQEALSDKLPADEWARRRNEQVRAANRR